MKLPIVQSILFGILFPNVTPIVRRINGKQRIVPADYSPNDFNGAPDDLSMMIIKYESYDEDPDDYVNFPSLRTRYVLNYLALSRAFSSIPSTLFDLEQLCIKNLSPYVEFDFESERPVDVSKVAPSKYTPVFLGHFPVDFQLFNYNPQYPFAKFYVNVIHTEMERIKLALLDYVQKSQSDILSKSEIEDTLSLMKYYATEAKEKQDDYLLSQKVRRVKVMEIEQNDYEFNVFPLLQLYLVKTYLEIEILFQPILKKNIEQDFDDLMYDCFKQYPDDSCKSRLQAAILTNEAQHLIQMNDINALTSLHPELVRLYSANTDNQSFLAVFKAVEHAIFLGDNTDILQLVDEKFCKTQFREKKKALEEEINALTNPREIQSVIEDELDQLDLFEDNNIPFQSIPRRLCSWLTAQLETTKQNLGNIFLPASKNSIEQSPSKQKVSKSSVRDQIKVVKSHLDFLTGYINNEKIMKDDDYENLIQFITSFLTEKKVPVISARIRTNTTQVFLRYTFYLMYKDLKLKQPSRNAWVSLLHAIFPQFDDTDESVTYKKFSTKPDLYDSDKKSILASQP